MNSVKPDRDQLRFAKLTVGVLIDKTSPHLLEGVHALIFGKLRLVLTLFVIFSGSMSALAHAASLDEMMDYCKRSLTGLEYVFGEFPELKITEEQVKRQTTINQTRLNETLFILPANDGEAVRAVQILKALNAPHLYLTQSRWGTKLRDLGELPHLLWKHAGVKQVAILEIPGPAEEETMRKLGLDVVVFDHHHYGEELNRTTAQSSLEQLMAWIGWSPSRDDNLISINDRSYIPGLVAFGATTDEIRFIRTYDLVAQGRSRGEVKREIEYVQTRVIPEIPSEGGVYIVTEKRADETILKQELALIQIDGKANILFLGGDRIGFTGSPAAAKKLNEIDFTEYGYAKTTRSGKKAFNIWGGGDPDGSIFFNFVPNYPPLYTRKKGGKGEHAGDEPGFASELRNLLGTGADRLLGERAERSELIPARVRDDIKALVLKAVIEEQRKQPGPTP